MIKSALVLGVTAFLYVATFTQPPMVGLSILIIGGFISLAVFED